MKHNIFEKSKVDLIRLHISNYVCRKAFRTFMLKYHNANFNFFQQNFSKKY